MTLGDVNRIAFKIVTFLDCYITLLKGPELVHNYFLINKRKGNV